VVHCVAVWWRVLQRVIAAQTSEDAAKIGTLLLLPHTPPPWMRDDLKGEATPHNLSL